MKEPKSMKERDREVLTSANNSNNSGCDSNSSSSENSNNNRTNQQQNAYASTALNDCVRSHTHYFINQHVNFYLEIFQILLFICVQALASSVNEPLIVCAPHNFLFFFFASFFHSFCRFFSLAFYSLVAVDKSQKYTLNLNNWNFELFLTFVSVSLILSLFLPAKRPYHTITLSDVPFAFISFRHLRLFSLYISVLYLHRHTLAHTVRCIRFIYLAFQRCIISK